MAKNLARLNHKGENQIDLSSVAIPKLPRKPHAVSTAHQKDVRLIAFPSALTMSHTYVTRPRRSYLSWVTIASKSQLRFHPFP